MSTKSFAEENDVLSQAPRTALLSVVFLQQVTVSLTAAGSAWLSMNSCPEHTPECTLLKLKAVSLEMLPVLLFA